MADGSEKRAAVDAAYAEFLRTRRANPAVEFDDFCRAHPELEFGLRIVHSLGGPEGTIEEEAAFEALIRQELGVDTAASPHRSPGRMVGRYKLLQPIGEGGFGSVWMAEQTEPVKRRVALKVIKLGMDTRQVIARFEAERQALAMMDHPNIAKVLDAGATEMGRPYFVMELVRGVPILEYCDREKCDTRARLGHFISVCHAIQHAHQKGIIHRDIKPSNVLVTLHDGVPVPKVIDFGVAKATCSELTTKTLFTEHRQMIGTPAYMSPEQAEMSGLDIDTRSDIYSLGVLLYELLTGTTPFDSKELISKGFAEMMRIIREVEPHKPSTRISALGDTGTRTAQQRQVAGAKRLGTVLRGDLDWIVMKCLEKDRRRRYETANGLAADIERHLNDEPVTAGPPSAGYRLRKFLRRNRAAMVAVSLIVLVLFLGVIGTCVALVAAFQQQERAETAEENTRRELIRTLEVKRLITQMLGSVTPEKAKGADITLLKGILDGLAGRLEKGEVRDEQVAAELHHVVGTAYWSLGLYDAAERHVSVAVEIRTRLLGAEHAETLGSMNSLALIYQAQGRYAEAEPLCLTTWELRRRVLGEEHVDTFGSQNNLAALYKEQGRYAEAEPLYLRALEIETRVLGEEHANTLSCMNNLALLYTEQGRYTEAEPLQRKGLELRTRALGEEHPGTLGSMNNLAVLYRKLGRWAEAEPLQLRALELRERVLGEEHPGTLSCMNNLAVLYREQRRYAEAEPLFLRALEIEKRVLGAEHPGTVAFMNSLAGLYAAEGRYAEAEPLYANALEIMKRVLGEEHPDTLGITNNLASLHVLQGRHAEAEPLYAKTLEIRQRVLGEEHPDTLGTSSSLGALYNAMHRYDEARRLYESSVPIYRRAMGTRHPWTGDAMRDLARAYVGLGRRADALALHRDLLELQLAAAGEPAATADAWNSAAWTLLTHDFEELRDAARALPLAERACAEEEGVGGGNLWRYFDTLALAHYRTGDTPKAIESQKRAIALIPEGTPETTVAESTASLRIYEDALEAQSRMGGD